MKSYRLLVAMVFVATIVFSVPCRAADRTAEITAWASYVDPNSKGTFNASNPNQPFDVDLDGKLGYGVSANVFWSSNISTEFSASEVRPDARFGAAGLVAGGDQSLKMIPISAVLQWHLLAGAPIDPYVGAGATYVLFDDLRDSNDLRNLGVDRIKFKDDAGLVVNAGVGFAITPRFAITVDGKYIPLKSSAKAVFVTGPESGARVKINPVILSAGLTFRF